ncbi:hypothetical protein BH23ACT6_BH23ACT6_02830 [soil metagenome]
MRGGGVELTRRFYGAGCVNPGTQTLVGAELSYYILARSARMEAT